MSNNELTPLGEEIQREMAFQRLSQRDLAQRAGIGQGTLSRVMRGVVTTPDPATLDAIAQALDWDTSYVMRLAGLPLPPDYFDLDPKAKRIAQRIDALPMDWLEIAVASLGLVLEGIERAAWAGQGERP